MATEPRSRDEARFVFRGTVRKPGAATVSQLAGRRDVATVRVDQIIRGPDVLSDFTGRDITVQLPPNRSALKARQQATFYTNPTTLSDSLAVQALDYEIPAQAGTPAAAAAAHAPADRLRHEDLRERMASADVVVSGKVASVHLANDSPSGPARAAAATAGESAPATTRISEHMPRWRDAVIEVAAVHKGHHTGPTAVVRFPASTDVRWQRAAKFTPGQSGYFLLHRGPSVVPRDQPRAAAVAEASGGEVYTSLHPLDFQPYDAEDTVQRIVRGETP